MFVPRRIDEGVAEVPGREAKVANNEKDGNLTWLSFRLVLQKSLLLCYCRSFLRAVADLAFQPYQALWMWFAKSPESTLRDQPLKLSS